MLEEQVKLLENSTALLIQDRIYEGQTSTILRNLLLESSSTKPLLFRLCEYLKVDDTIDIHAAPFIKEDHPHAQGLVFYRMPFAKPDYLDFDTYRGLPPLQISFKEAIERMGAMYCSGRILTPKDIIDILSNQIGIAHTSEAVDPVIFELKSVLANNRELYHETIITCSKIALEISHRVFKKALSQKDFEYHRKLHPHPISIEIPISILGLPKIKETIIDITDQLSCINIRISIDAKNIYTKITNCNSFSESSIPIAKTDDSRKTSIYIQTQDHSVINTLLSTGQTSSSPIPGKCYSIGPVFQITPSLGSEKNFHISQPRCRQELISLD